MAKWILDLYAYNYVDVVFLMIWKMLQVLKKIKNTAAFIFFLRNSFIIHISLSNKEGFIVSQESHESLPLICSNSWLAS